MYLTDLYLIVIDKAEDETEEERTGDVVSNLGIEKTLERDSRSEAE